MFRVQAPVIVIPTAEVRQATGKHFRAAMIDAYRAIARNGSNSAWGTQNYPPAP
jgi:hypothetical protein